MYASLECINIRQQDGTNNQTKEDPIAVGFIILSPFGNQYCSYFGINSGDFLVNGTVTLEKLASEIYKTNIPAQWTPQEEVQFQQPIFVGCVKSLFQQVKNH